MNRKEKVFSWLLFAIFVGAIASATDLSDLNCADGQVAVATDQGTWVCGIVSSLFTWNNVTVNTTMYNASTLNVTDDVYFAQNLAMPYGIINLGNNIDTSQTGRLAGINITTNAFAAPQIKYGTLYMGYDNEGNNIAGDARIAVEANGNTKLNISADATSGSGTVYIRGSGTSTSKVYIEDCAFDGTTITNCDIVQNGSVVSSLTIQDKLRILNGGYIHTEGGWIYQQGSNITLANGADIQVSSHWGDMNSTINISGGGGSVYADYFFGNATYLTGINSPNNITTNTIIANEWIETGGTSFGTTFFPGLFSGNSPIDVTMIVVRNDIYSNLNFTLPIVDDYPGKTYFIVAQGTSWSAWPNTSVIVYPNATNNDKIGNTTEYTFTEEGEYIWIIAEPTYNNWFIMGQTYDIPAAAQQSGYLQSQYFENWESNMSNQALNTTSSVTFNEGNFTGDLNATRLNIVFEENTIGNVDNTGRGSTVLGFVDDWFDIGIAWGYFESSGDGSIAAGYATGNGAGIVANGSGSMAGGSSGAGTIWGDGEGSFTWGGGDQGTSGLGAVNFGRGNDVTGDYSGAFGDANKVYCNNCFAFGPSNQLNAVSTYGTTIGWNNRANDSAAVFGSVAIGTSSSVSSAYSYSIGYSAHSKADNCITIGRDIECVDPNTLHLGISGDALVFNSTHGNITKDLFVAEDLEWEKKEWGQMTYHNDTTPLTVDITDTTRYFPVTGLNNSQCKLCSSNTSHFTIATTGTYRIASSVSFAGTASQEYQIDALLNDEEIDWCEAHRVIGSGGDVGNAGINCIHKFEANDIIAIGIQNEGAANDAEVYAMHFNIERID